MVKPLLKLLKIVFQQVGNRTTRAAASIKLVEIGRSEKEREALHLCKKAPERQFTLAHRDNDRLLCVYANERDTVWSGMVTPVPCKDMSKSHVFHRHEPLIVLSGHFSGLQLGCLTLDKEVCTVMSTTDWIHRQLTTPNGFDLFTCH